MTPPVDVGGCSLKIPDEISLRPIKCELNALSKPDGSAMLSQGNTVVLAAVFGPDESRLNRLQFEKVQFDALFQSKFGTSAEVNTAYDTAIKSACIETLYPKVYARSDISLIIQEMQNRGSMLACAINAGCLAMLNTGLEMKCLVGAVTCMIGHDNSVLIDPDDVESENARALITLTFESLTYSLVQSDSTGTFTYGEYVKIIALCREIVKTKIIPFYKSIVEKYIKYL